MKIHRNSISNSLLLILFFALLISSSSTEVVAQSLFDRRSQNQIDQYRDYAARHRGDLLTVMIQENTAVQNRDERSLDKSGNSSVAGTLNYGLGGNLGTAAGDGTLGKTSASTRAFSGDTEFRSARQFTDQFTVTIVDVLPNGNLVVRGERAIVVQGDERRLQLSGVVRQFDILPNNQVPSHLVAELKISLNAKGAEQAYNKQGWFSRRVNKVWPF